MIPKHRAHAGLAVLVGILVACSPPLAELPTPEVVTREPGTATLPAPTIAPATPTPDAPPATATLEPTATATLVPFAEHLPGVAVGLGGPFPPDVVSLTSVVLADNKIRRQFNELGVAPVMDAAGQVGVEVCYYDGQCAVILTAPNVYEGLALDPKSPRTNEMLAAYVDPATGQEAGYLVRKVVYEDAVDGVGKGANADAGAKRDYMWGVQNGKMMLVEVEDGVVRVVRPAYAFFPADPNNPPRYDPATETLEIAGQTIVRGVGVEMPEPTMFGEELKVIGSTWSDFMKLHPLDKSWNLRCGVDGTFIEEKLPIPGVDGATTEWAVRAHYFDPQGVEKTAVVAVVVRLADGSLIDTGSMPAVYSEQELRESLARHPRSFLYGEKSFNVYISIFTDLSDAAYIRYGFKPNRVPEFRATPAGRMYEQYVRANAEGLKRFIETGDPSGLGVIVPFGFSHPR